MRVIVNRSGTPLRRQQGLVLFIALIVLVAMTLAGIGMVRSVDTGNVIAGNLAFKQATIQASDNGIETGYQWLLANTGGTTLNNTDAGSAYYSSPPANDLTLDWFDLANWAGAICVPAACTEDAAGNTTRYIVHRMCLNPNSAYNAANQQQRALPATPRTPAAAGSGRHRVSPRPTCSITASWRGCGRPAQHHEHHAGLRADIALSAPQGAPALSRSRT